MAVCPQSWLRKGQRVIVFLVEDVKLSTYLFIFMLVVLGLGWAYACLTPLGQGIGQNTRVLDNTSILQGLYFSVITISSLGYGDLHPMGLSKLLACCEVLFGLAFMGIIIAKITSRRLSYHVQRLFSSDAKKRLEYFTHNFQESEQNIGEVMKNLGEVYQRTPRKQLIPQKDAEVAATRFASSLVALRTRLKELFDYLSFEIEQGHYFDIVPTDAIVLIGNSLEQMWIILGQLIISLPPENKNELLNVQNRKSIYEAVESQKAVCSIIGSDSKNPEAIQCFERLLSTCNRVYEGYFAVPTTAPAAQQPDQVLQGADEPLEPQDVPPKENMNDFDHPTGL